jgi:hypothetical protein
MGISGAHPRMTLMSDLMKDLMNVRMYHREPLRTPSKARQCFKKVAGCTTKKSVQLNCSQYGENGSRVRTLKRHQRKYR